MSSENSSVRLFQHPLMVLILLGSALLGGLLGVGGGILLVPGLTLVTGIKQKIAHGSSLCAVIFLSGAATVGYILDGSVNYWAALFLVLGAWSGVRIGTWILHNIHVRSLKLVFGILICVASARLFLGLEGMDPSVGLGIALALGCLGLGTLSGFLSGLLGIGGGFVLVPGLIFFFDLMGVDARGTSLLTIMLTATMGTLRNTKFGNVDLRLGLTMGGVGATVSFVGALASSRISERVLTIFLGCLLVVIAARMFWEFWKWEEQLDIEGS